MVKHTLTMAVVLSWSGSAIAQEPAPVLLQMHDAATTPALVDASLAFAIPNGAVFAAAGAGVRLESTKKRPRLRGLVGHGFHGFNEATQVLEFPSGDSLSLLRNNGRSLRIVRFEAKAKRWTQLDRPMGFVPRGASAVDSFAVFPQGQQSTAWFVYDSGAGALERVPLPDGTQPCPGVVIRHDKTVIAASHKSQCALAYDPAKKRFTTLEPPPAELGPLAQGFKSKTCAFGNANATVCFDGKKWTQLPPMDAPADAWPFATTTKFGAWKLARGQLSFWQSDGRSVQSTAEDLGDLLPSTVAAGPGTWWIAARHNGRPVLLQMELAPRASTKQLQQNRAEVLGAGRDDTDWKTATDDERKAGITKGLGAVERYVPPEVDENGRVTTKGAWVFAIGEELFVWPTTPRQCESFINRLIRKWPTTVIDTGWETHRGPGFARVANKLVYGPAGQCRAAQKCASDFYSERNTPLSQIGPIFSYATHKSSATDCADPVSTERWTALDLRTQKPAPLDALIDPNSILAALKKHSWTRATVASSNTLDDAINALKAVDPQGFQGYAFGHFRSASGEVQLRIEFHKDSPDLVTPISIWVAPRDEFRETFENAARRKGLYMSDAQ